MIMTNEDEKGRVPPHEAMGETGVTVKFNFKISFSSANLKILNFLTLIYSNFTR